MSGFQKNIIISAFSQAVREAAFSPRHNSNLVEGTVATTISYVAQAFWSNNRKDPRLDEDGKVCFLLQEQFRGYRNQDGKKQKQKALPLSVLRKLHDLAISDLEKAIAWLLIGAIFFAMRSCEYLKTSEQESSKRTKVITIGDIIFKKGNAILHHSSPKLDSADLVMITFKFQKNNRRNQTVHMFNSRDKTLNPVIAWTRVIQRIRNSIPNFSESTKVCEFLQEDKIIEINSTQARNQLRAVVNLIGEASLGFGSSDVGLHSIRSGGAMAMFLSGVATIIIQ